MRSTGVCGTHRYCTDHILTQARWVGPRHRHSSFLHPSHFRWPSHPSVLQLPYLSAVIHHCMLLHHVIMSQLQRTHVYPDGVNKHLTRTVIVKFNAFRTPLGTQNPHSFRRSSSPTPSLGIGDGLDRSFQKAHFGGTQTPVLSYHEV